MELDLVMRCKEVLERIKVRYRDEPGFASDIGGNAFDYLLEDLNKYVKCPDCSGVLNLRHGARFMCCGGKTYEIADHLIDGDQWRKDRMAEILRNQAERDVPFAPK